MTAPTYTNADLAAVLDELGDLYELDGASFHRILAYRNAARVIASQSPSVAKMVTEGTVTELSGIGKTLDEKLTSLIETGEIPALERLRSTYPAGLRQIMALQGVGAKTARKLFDELKVDGLDSLAAALNEGKVAKLAGFGAKKEQAILSALQRAQAAATTGTSDRVPLSEALGAADPIIAELNAVAERAGTTMLELAGSARRQSETVHDLDIIAAASEAEVLIETFRASEHLATILRSGPAGISGLTQQGLQIDLKVVSNEQAGNLLQHFTGSAAHNTKLRERAVKQGLRVSEYGILDESTGVSETFTSEQAVYNRLGMEWIPPEMREDRGELELAAAAHAGGSQMSELIVQGDLRGDLHCHTVASDGQATRCEMAQAAINLGYEYLCITDHSATHGFGNEVSEDRLWQLIDESRELRAELQATTPGFNLLIGSEVNIDPHGGLDYSDELLAALDWVVGSVHTNLDQNATERAVTACQNPLVDAIGHPTGRKLGKRPPSPLDVSALIDAAAATGTFLEINGSPLRRDLNESHCQQARDAGVKLLCSSDAHSTQALSNVRWGIATARRGWISKQDVVNTYTWQELQSLRKPARKTKS